MNKWLWRVASFLLAVGLLMGCSSGNNNNDADESANTSQNGTDITENTTENDKNEDTVKITLSVHEESEFIDELDVEIEDGDILMDVLKQNFEVDEDKGYINSIQGKEPEDDDEAWMIFVNGDQADKGANDLELSPGDEVSLDLQAY